MKRVIYKGILGNHYTIIDGRVMTRNDEFDDWRVSAYDGRLDLFNDAIKKGAMKEVDDERA